MLSNLGEGTWISVAKECIGYTQVDCTLDLYLDGPVFDTLSSDQYALRKFGREVDLVSQISGVVRTMPGDKIIRSLPSFHSISWEVKPGDFLYATVDCFTRPGVVQIIGNTDEECNIDVKKIHDLGSSGYYNEFYHFCCSSSSTFINFRTWYLY